MYAGQSMHVLEADFSGTATSLFEVTRKPCDVGVSIRDTASGADGVYYLQHLDYSTPASPAWVNAVGSTDALTAVSGSVLARVFPNLAPGLYRFYTASESGVVDVFVSGEQVNVDNLTDPTS